MHIGFAFPNSSLPFWMGALALATVALVFALRALERRRQSRLGRFADSSLVPRLLVGYDAAVRRPLNLLATGGFILLALALFQPHWGQAWQEVSQTSRDVLILLDTSESMRATNPLPDRLERAKQEITSLLERAPGDRFGLVAFSGAAALQCPLTLDQGYFRAVLNAVDTNTISREGTDIASALREAIVVFEEEQERTGDYDRNSRGVLLISDGEQVSGDAVAVAEQLSEYARVFVIGVGNPDGAVVSVPNWMGAYSNRLRGNETHVSRLDEDTLMRVATAGNGAYARSQVDSWEIDQIYERFKSLAARDVSGALRLRLVNRYQWPLAGAILCLVGEGLWLVVMPWLRRWRLWRRSSSIANAVEGGTQHA